MGKHRGTVAKWLNHKGIGFITPEGEEGEDKDILVHYTQIKQDTKDGFRSLNTGAVVEYDLEADPKNTEKMVAVNVTGEGGEECEPRQPKGKGKCGKKGGKKGKGKGKGKGKKGKGDDDDDEDEE